jgi:MazG family protein
MRPYLLEEAHEVLAAVDAGDRVALAEELGDLLFQVVFLARLAEEEGAFDLDAVVAGIERKMVERHPHVFGAGGDGTLAGWETRKARHKASRVDGVPPALPALLRAHRVGEKVAAVGFDWPDVVGVLAKVDEERTELAEALASGDAARIEHEYGDLLLACASLGRFIGVAGEDALRVANRRFEGRFRAVEAKAREAGVPLQEAGLERLERWWQEVK